VEGSFDHRGSFEYQGQIYYEDLTVNSKTKLNLNGHAGQKVNYVGTTRLFN